MCIPLRGIYINLKYILQKKKNKKPKKENMNLLWLFYSFLKSYPFTVDVIQSNCYESLLHIIKHDRLYLTKYFVGFFGYLMDINHLMMKLGLFAQSNIYHKIGSLQQTCVLIYPQLNVILYRRWKSVLVLNKTKRNKLNEVFS